MSNTWSILRSNILVADLATTDTDVEGQQAANTGLTFVSPSRHLVNTSELVTEFGIMVLAYDEFETTVLAGTATIQVLEEAPDPTAQDDVSSTRKLYAGRAPVLLHPMGRIHTFPARYVHKFTVLISALADAAMGAHHLRAFWRAIR